MCRVRTRQPATHGDIRQTTNPAVSLSIPSAGLTVGLMLNKRSDAHGGVRVLCPADMQIRPVAHEGGPGQPRHDKRPGPHSGPGLVGHCRTLHRSSAMCTVEHANPNPAADCGLAQATRPSVHHDRMCYVRVLLFALLHLRSMLAETFQWLHACVRVPRPHALSKGFASNDRSIWEMDRRKTFAHGNRLGACAALVSIAAAVALKWMM